MSTAMVPTKSAKIRDQLGHPVLDCDGHYIEVGPAFRAFVNDHGAGHLLPEGEPFRPDFGAFWQQWGGPEDWKMQHRPAPLRGFAPGDTDYFATVTSPRRLHARLWEAGIDYSVVYPSQGLALHYMDDERRVTLSKLHNAYLAEEYGPYADRLTPAALVPMNTPEEAIEVLEDAVALGLKVACIPSFVSRPIPGFRDAPERYRQALVQVDAYGLDSPYDYDPFWATVVELGVPITAHSTTMGFTDRCSPTNAVFNQLGNFAVAGELLARALFLGGVTQRFPALRVGFLEGGVGHGVRLFADLCSRWNVRRPEVLGRRDMSAIDNEALAEMYAEDGGWLARVDAKEFTTRLAPPSSTFPNDFSRVKIDSYEDIRDAYCTNFVWGCEAEDPLVPLGFLAQQILPTGPTLSVVMGSDLGHWDVPDFELPLAEAYEFVEHGALSPEQFRDFVFANGVRFHGAANPDFYVGTTIEAEAREVLNDVA